MPPHSLAAAAAEITAQQGLCKMLKFQDLGGTLTPPSDDPQDWWEPETLTHRAELHGIKTSAGNFYDAITAWTKAAHQASARNRRATDGRPDCPYNGQGLAPESSQVSKSADQISCQDPLVSDAQPRSSEEDLGPTDRPALASRRFEAHQVSPVYSLPPPDVQLIEPSQVAKDTTSQTQQRASSPPPDKE